MMSLGRTACGRRALAGGRTRAPSRRSPAACRAAEDTKPAAADSAAPAATVTAEGAAQNGAPATPAAPLPTILDWTEPDSMRRLATNTKLAFALPQRRFKKGSYLTIRLEGDLPEKRQSRFSGNTSLALTCESIRKAAYDPRISGIIITVDLLSCGWAKVQELRKYLEFFRESGKDTMAYMERGGEKEYFLATACAEIYIPPTAQLALKGLSVSGAFLRGVLDKVGVEPQVKRIGKYKSAGDQLLRRDMSEAQREQLSALLDDIYGTFLSTVAKARGKSEDDVAALLDAGVYDMQKLADGGWVTGLKYADEVKIILQERTGGKDSEVAAVPLRRYKYVDSGAFGLKGRKKIAIVRETGAITGARREQGGQITTEPLIKKLRTLAKQKSISGIVLRVDSPGGDALASDLMWREIKQIAKDKPLVATMGDVAASGGYYMSMAAPTVLAQPLTITGSIGVVTGKFNFAELFEKVGYGKEVISRGKFAELLQDYRPFNEDEKQFFDESAQFAYESFRDRAAESRGMAPEEMQELAQGRVWSGHRALGNKLVDHLGGMDTAIALVKEKANIPASEAVTQLEVSVDTPSPLSLVTGGSSLSSKEVVGLVLTDPGFLFTTFGITVLPIALQWAASAAFSALTGPEADGTGRPQLVLDQVFQGIADGSIGRAMHSLIFPQAVMPHVDVKTSIDAATQLRDLFR